jgi:Tol biopolymer transport system component
MGEVYRATDTNLKRLVAIKVLPESVAADPERLARFQREAEVLAALNHPNIAAIYGLERSGTERALVMELVEGPTLADRIAAGAIPLDEALPIAKQIAEALEAAHEQGIIHRDLKPANIKVRADGTVKVLDFGLAKAMESVAATLPSFSLSPTLTTPAMTQVGTIFGTAAYMSPEQARGRPLDKRTDIWAFGVVLYEMLAGTRAFEGEDVTEMIASVVKTTPDWSALPGDVPRPILTLIQRCLEKDRKARVGDISAARFQLAEYGNFAIAPDHAALAPLPRAGWARVLPWAVAGIMTGAAALTGFLYVRQTPTPTAGVVRFDVAPPEDAPFDDQIRISPDGRLIAFSAAGGGDTRRRLWVRALDSLLARPLPGTEGTTDGLFWLADSRTLVFAAAGKLKKINVGGGPAQTLCDFNLNVGGGFLTPDNNIVFGTPSTSLQTCPANGGAATAITALQADGQEAFHAFPSLLPDGRHFLFWRSAGPASGIYLGSLEAKPEDQMGTRVLADASAPFYVPNPEGGRGHLLFVRDGTLMAQGFDAQAQAVTGDAVPVGEDLRNAYGFSASQNGTLVYLTAGGSNMQLTWFDRLGKTLGTVGRVGRGVGARGGMRMSPDGTRLAVSRREPGAQPDIWVLDLVQGVETRLTTDPAADADPIWSPDGSRIAFASVREGTANIYLRAADGAGSDELLLRTADRKFPRDWSRDGRFLLFDVLTATGFDVWVLQLRTEPPGQGRPVPYLHTDAYEARAVFSPDGRFVAYESNESGPVEVYVRPFDATAPEASGTGPGKVKVSRNGGTRPEWESNGKGLSYATPDLKRWWVDVTVTPTLRLGEPQLLGEFPRGIATMTPDGQRVLIGVPVGEQRQSATVVLNWQAGLNQSSR